jgi:nucleotide-binding universal stress UspA family protein
MTALVVGYDGTAGARAAVREAARLAKPLGAVVVVAFAHHVPPAGGEVADLAATLRERGEAVLAEALATLREAGVEARAELVDDKPAEALVRLADAEDAAMIVVGSYGETPLRGALLGSTSYRLLHRSERPVLVVRA